MGELDKGNYVLVVVMVMVVVVFTLVARFCLVVLNRRLFGMELSNCLQ